MNDINNISMNENVCENEVSVLSTNECDTNQVSDSSPFCYPNISS